MTGWVKIGCSVSLLGVWVHVRPILCYRFAWYGVSGWHHTEVMMKIVIALSMPLAMLYSYFSVNVQRLIKLVDYVEELHLLLPVVVHTPKDVLRLVFSEVRPSWIDFSECRVRSWYPKNDVPRHGHLHSIACGSIGYSKRNTMVTYSSFAYSKPT